MPPSADTTTDVNEENSAMPDMVSKRRNGGVSANISLLPKAPAAATTTIPATISFVAGRRRRLFAYLAAFAVMLALSSMLDLRRAALSAKRHDRITLQAPPGSPATVIDEENSHPADGAAVAHEAELIQNQNNPPPPPPPPPLVSNADHSPAHGDDVHSQHSNDDHNIDGTNTATTNSVNPHDRKLSDQELADDVDQLISHVEQEKAVANTSVSSHSNETRINTTKSSSTIITNTTPVTDLKSSKSAGGSGGAVPIVNSNNESPVPAANSTAETVEEQFAAAQLAMDAAASNETLKRYLDPQEARTLKALALQGARGDCEKAGDPSGGSLFKTDAEAASGDIEKTDPLWGAWCVFSGRYRSDAMRDYVARTRALRARLVAKAESGAVVTDPTTESFDETAATLDDVLPPEDQAVLRRKAETVVPHLSESDARLLAALALQATLGDCGLYSKDRVKRREMDGSATPPRELVEPLFGKKALRGEGTLWGAWCVFARRKRAAAVATLKDRIEQFYKQLATNRR